MQPKYHTTLRSFRYQVKTGISLIISIELPPRPDKRKRRPPPPKKRNRNKKQKKKQDDAKTLQHLQSDKSRERDKDRRRENTRGKRWVETCIMTLRLSMSEFMKAV